MSERPNFAKVLAEHEWTWAKRDKTSGDGVMLGCTGCDWTHEPSGAVGLGWSPHHTHLAAVLNAEVDRWLADEGTRTRVADAIVDGALRASQLDNRAFVYATAALAALATPTVPTTEEQR